MLVSGINSNFSVNRKQKRPQKPSFGKAYVNILSMSDNHGTLSSLPKLYDTVKNNSDKIFSNNKSKSTLNIFAQVGDLFMNPLKKGYFSCPNMTSGDIQLTLFEKLVESTKKVVKGSKFSAIYTPGNHCFDGGELFSGVKKAKSFETILTNATIDNAENIVKQKIYSISDDKNPQLKHKLLVLGLTPQNLDFYVPGIKGVSVLDRNNKKYESLIENDLSQTICEISKRISAFKSQNPKGAVFINSHTGQKISEIIAEKVSGINLILNGHDHKLEEKTVNGALIVSHGQNNEFLRGVKLFFDDDGNSSIKHVDTFFAKDSKHLDENPISKTLELLMGKDTKPLLNLSDNAELKIDGVRYQNSPLANLITDIVQSKLKEISPKLNATGIISSTFRGDLKNGATNLEIMKVLDGSIESQSDMQIAKLKGSELLKILSENVQSNLEAPDRNSIIQWSGISIDKKAFANNDLKKAFKIKKNNDAVFENINPSTTYEIAMQSKFVQKYCPKDLVEKFVSTGNTINNIFVENLRKNDYNLEISPEIYKNRINN